MKKIISFISVASLMAMMLVLPSSALAATPNWDVSGSWVFDYNDGSVNLHDMTLVQDGAGVLTGSGGAFSGDIPYDYPWTITSGLVDGNSINFTANYNLLACSFTATGTIVPGGAMSGTWSDNCGVGGATRIGTWSTTSGNAVAIPASPFTHTQKNLTTWAPSGITANVAYSTDVNGKFSATGVPTGYTLVYYPNVGTYDTYTGDVYPVEGTNMNLPMANDLNGLPGSDYCTNNLNPGVTGEACFGAKLWLVPTTNISTTINANGSQTIDWSGASNFLFETGLINYTATLPAPTTPTNKDQCKDDGWMSFTHTFKNQGQCVSYVQANERAGKK